MYAKLGDIVFDQLKGFNDFNKTGSANYAEHKPIIGKPRLQPVGTSLDELSLSMRLHSSFCNPIEELALLKKYRDTNQVLELSFGVGRKEGNFVITSINDAVEDANPGGEIFSYMVSCTLKEFVIDPLRAEQVSNVDNAAAVGKDPVAKKKKNYPRCPKEISGLVTKIDNHAQAINVIILQKGGVNIAYVNNRPAILTHLQGIKTQNNTLLTKCDDPNNCAHAYSDLKYRAVQVSKAEVNFTNALNGFGLDFMIPDQNKIMLACVRNLKTAAAPLIKKSITPIS